MNNEILVSVIMPTYKRSTFLHRAINSVLTQTYDNIELLVVDDNEIGSQESVDVKNIIEEFNDKRIKYVKTPGKLGGGAARNYSFKSISGFYVAFLDDDDIFKANKIETQLDFMLKTGLEMSYQDVEWHMNDTDKLIELRKLDRVKDFSKEGLLKAHILSTISPTAIYMIKTECLLKTKGFGEVPRGQDTILMIRCIEADIKIGYMPGSYVIQYIHSGERTSNGKKFVDGQKQLYKVLCGYKTILNRKERRYVDFRFNAVCFMALLRDKRMFSCIPYFFKAFFISPGSCYLEAKKYFSSKIR